MYSVGYQDLIIQKGYATTMDISNYLNVSFPNVTKMIQNLDESGYLIYEKYMGIRPTDDRIKIAKSIHNRHEILAEFFRMIGVDDEIANNDAEGMEDHLHHETLKKLEEFMTSMNDKSVRTMD
jgi:Mn-dependent DtxR family transcriptional regulator